MTSAPKALAWGRGTKSLGTKPLTLTLSRREGAPLNWRPSADAVAGNGGTLSYSLRSPSADAVAGRGKGGKLAQLPTAADSATSSPQNSS